MMFDETETDPPHAAMANEDRERRGGRRHAIVLLVGKVSRGPQDSICLVHDISRTGLMARFTVPPIVGERLCIAVRGLPPIAGTVRWTNGFKAGFQFDAPQDVDHVFKPRDDDGLIPRTPRFPIRAAARLRVGDVPFAAALLDISPGGAKLSSDTPVERGQTGQIMLPDTGTAIYGTICWTREDRFGFRFVAPLSLETLTHILGC